MPRYRVNVGEVLPHNGQLLEAGAFVELPRVVAEDTANRHLVQEVDAAGQPVAPRPVDDLERFRTHERIGILRTRLADAKGLAERIQAQLDAEEQRLVDEVKAASTTREQKKFKPTTETTSVKE